MASPGSPPLEESPAAGLREETQGLFAAHEVPVRLQGLPMAFHARFDESTDPVTAYAQLQQLDAERYADFARRLIQAGVWVAYRGIWYVSAAHTARDIDDTIERVETALTVR